MDGISMGMKKTMTILACGLALGWSLVCAGCKDCGCSRAGTEDTDAGDGKKDETPVDETDQADQAAGTNGPGESTRRAGTSGKGDNDSGQQKERKLVEMKPGAVIKTTGGSSGKSPERPNIDVNVPPKTIDAIRSLKEFQDTNPRFVKGGSKRGLPSKKTSPPASHELMNPQTTTPEELGLRKVQQTGKAP